MSYGKNGYVYCPIAGPNENKANVPMSGKKLRIDPKSSLWVPRITCVVKNRDVCIYCPNYRFTMELKVVGKDEDFEWISKALRKAGSVVSHGRTYGEDELHKDCVICKFEIMIAPEEIGSRKIAEALYSVIMEESKESKHRVEYVSITNRKVSYDVTLALRSQ